MAKSVAVVTRDPDFYLLLGHILARDGYLPSLVAPENLEREKLDTASVVIVDCSAVHEMTVCCRLLRNLLNKTVPIFAFLAARDEAHYLSLTRAGATECIVRPASPEFVLRSLASNPLAIADATAARILVELPDGEILMDIPNRELSMGSRTMRLSPTEFRLLEKLLDLRGHVISRRELADVWPSGRYVSEHTLDVHISKLRKALRDVSGDPLIRTVRQKGFVIAAAPSSYKT